MPPFRAHGVEQRERAPHDAHEVVCRGGQSKAGRGGRRCMVLSRIESSSEARGGEAGPGLIARSVADQYTAE